MKYFILFIVVLSLTNCTTYKDEEYNPFFTIFRLTTGNLK